MIRTWYDLEDDHQNDMSMVIEPTEINELEVPYDLIVLEELNI